MGLENKMLGYQLLLVGEPCASPLSLSRPFAVTWEAAGLAASGDVICPHARASMNDANTCMVIRAVY